MADIFPVPPVPPFDDAIKRLADDFIAVNQAGQAAKNRLEELEAKALAVVKVADPKLHQEILDAQQVVQRINDAYGQVDEHLRLWLGEPKEGEEE
jgi:ElaB/YqjD/DUF883 family membrane-anchored ribosome-binding protein